MVTIFGINVCGKNYLGRFAADAALRVLHRASFDCGRGKLPASMFAIETIGAKGLFTPTEAIAIVSRLIVS